METRHILQQSLVHHLSGKEWDKTNPGVDINTMVAAMGYYQEIFEEALIQIP
jgi:hypothetical protein